VLANVRFLLYIEIMWRNPTQPKRRNKAMADTHTARKQPRKNEANDYALQLRLPAQLHQQMRERAERETLSINAWIRLACKKELRRKFLV
jgi:predicted HicB family RNase H-like nuclease